ncbi:Receptor-like protein 44 [Linum perenne]
MCAYLNVIDLHENLLTGQITQQLGLLVRLLAFDVSNNKLSGSIPASLGNRSGKREEEEKIGNGQSPATDGSGIPARVTMVVVEERRRKEKGKGLDFGLVIGWVFGIWVGFWVC